MTRTIALAHDLDYSGLHAAAPASPTAPAPLADTGRYDHPLFQRSEQGRYGVVTYYFAAFTGSEPEPQTPPAAYKALGRDQIFELGRQYEAARILWSKARLRRQAAPVLAKAAPVWEAWTAAKADLEGVYNAFWETGDGRWRAQLLCLTDAENAAEAAAGAWEEIGQQLAQLADDQVAVAGYDDELLLTTVATELGLDASDWHIDHIDAYTDRSWGRPTPLLERLAAQINTQRERLIEVARLAGDREVA
ncbi:hypothetical protein OHA79_52165 (plasmid) [Streptomyces sp. NBC_00841]|uniref:hypothetical protein n=1 Tax=Streptomyces sp. NBC_00841 TaxID=2975847 RepID=UPI002DDBCAEA|nr:hypothetical protein [Streptomyces sp. NBC_00841]WSA06038.1 hypothetical protein OHA79_52165 [Streptomyces sp. NBC_00841]